ncbi:MAG: GAF and ANTAR domain-containing protein [Intrasporangiaceae bacterium]|nr:GAF and ANTAR domain-containing protein [Intrasporangiaceae bacterium]
MAHRRIGIDLMEKISGVVRTSEELDSYVQDVCAVALNHFPACQGVALYLVLNGGMRPVGFTTRRESDEVAYLDPNDDECIANLRRPVKLAAVDRVRGSWPGFADFMDRQGFGTVLSVPLVVEDTLIGNMGLYAASPDDFDEVDVAVAGAAAQVCADTVAAALEIIDARGLAEQLETAMESRAAIEQAKGIIMALRGVTEDRAFEILRKSSQDRNIKVRTLAEQIVSGAVDLSSASSRR